jgi:hypothetical protein
MNMNLKFKAFLSRNQLEHKPFQAECFKWCAGKEQAEQKQAEQNQAEQKQAQVKGGILALEMGLGKTIIMLGLVKCNLKARTLIVLPRSLIDQWEKCIIQFCGYKPLVYHGSRPKNMTMWHIQAAQIVLTTYGQISLPSLKQAQKGRKLSLLHGIVWNRVICDEAHHVSHHNTNEFKGMQLLRSEICWLVSGTPLQNKEKELYNLYSLLGLSKSKVYYDAGENYTKTFKQVVFYKTKAGAGLVLPALHEHTLNIEWDSENALHIHSLVPCCHVPLKTPAKLILAEAENLRALKMKYLAKAKMACSWGAAPLHPLGGTPLQPPLEVIPTLDETLLQRGVVGGYPLVVGGANPLKINAVLKTLLDRKANGCGKIVFCHYYAEIDTFAQKLWEADPSLHIAKFDGRVPTSQRAKVLNEPVDILLAQIKMCREGLNLQDHYSEAYLPSPHFNPATEQQAIARCWRMGQKKEVHVFRYVLQWGAAAPQTPPPLGEGEIIPPLGCVETPLLGEGEIIPPLGCVETPLLGEGGIIPPASALPEMGVQGGCPLTMDTFSVNLHEKKRKFVERMAGAGASVAGASVAEASPSTAGPKIKIKIKKLTTRP